LFLLFFWFWWHIRFAIGVGRFCVDEILFFLNAPASTQHCFWMYFLQLDTI